MPLAVDSSCVAFHAPARSLARTRPRETAVKSTAAYPDATSGQSAAASAVTTGKPRSSTPTPTTGAARTYPPCAMTCTKETNVGELAPAWEPCADHGRDGSTFTAGSRWNSPAERVATHALTTTAACISIRQLATETDSLVPPKKEANPPSAPPRCRRRRHHDGQPPPPEEEDGPGGSASPSRAPYSRRIVHAPRRGKWGVMKTASRTRRA